MEQTLKCEATALAALSSCRTDLKTGDHVRGLECARAISVWALAEKSELIYAQACVLEASHLARGGLENEARQIAERTLPIVDRLGTLRETIEVRNIITRCYVNFGSPVLALPFALDALKRAQNLRDDTLLAWTHCRLGAVYGALQYMPRCIQMLEKAVGYAEKTSDNEVKFGTYQNLANNLRWEIELKAQTQPIETLNSFKTRIEVLLKKSIEYAEGQAIRELYVYRTEAGLYSCLMDAQGFSFAQKKYEAVCKKLNNPLHSFIVKVNHTYQMLLDGKGEQAADYLENVLEKLQDQVGDTSTYTEILKLRYLVNKRIGRTVIALEALETMYREQLTNAADLSKEQSQLLLGEIEVADAIDEAKAWREHSEKTALQVEQERLLARHDALTGLLNRRSFDEDILSTLDKLQESTLVGTALTILDVDHFKSINDTFGHSVGDQVLRMIGHALLEMVRRDDRVYRYGGEEFVILLETESRSDLADFCERAKNCISQVNWTSQFGTKLGRVTVSVGGTQIRSGDDANSIVTRADRAMYQAKRDGRNLARLG
jgi:diguanylate cyclase (GGDEF)-like protein